MWKWSFIWKSYYNNYWYKNNDIRLIGIVFKIHIIIITDDFWNNAYNNIKETKTSIDLRYIYFGLEHKKKGHNAIHITNLSFVKELKEKSEKALNHAIIELTYKGIYITIVIDNEFQLFNILFKTCKNVDEKIVRFFTKSTKNKIYFYYLYYVHL